MTKPIHDLDRLELESALKCSIANIEEMLTRMPEDTRAEALDSLAMLLESYCLDCGHRIDPDGQPCGCDEEAD